MAGFGLPAAFKGALSGTPIFFDGEATSIPGSDATIFSIVVGAGTTLNLTQLNCSAQFSGAFIMELNGDEIARCRVRSGRPDPFFTWYPARAVSEGDTISLIYRQSAQLPATLVQAFLMATTN